MSIMMDDKNKKYKITGIGEVLWDIFPGGKELGGAPSNFVYHVNRLGEEGLIASRVGDDSYGKEIIEKLSTDGISTDYIQIDLKIPTGKVLIEVDESGNPEFKCSENAAWDNIKMTDNYRKLAGFSNAIYFGALAQRSDQSRNTIYDFLDSSKSDCLRIFDINIRQENYNKDIIIESLKRTDILKINKNELEKLSEIMNIKGSEKYLMEKILETHRLRMIALTRGKEGSRLISSEDDVNWTGFRVDVVDTVGAGDAFCAALIIGLLNNMPIYEVNKFSNHIASFVCTKKGATPLIPDRILAEYNLNKHQQQEN